MVACKCKMKLYAVALTAKGPLFVLRAASITATDADEAIEYALDKCRELYPREQGWYDHGVDVIEVPVMEWLELSR